MTAAEAFELTTQGGTTDFARVIDILKRRGPYCVIGGLAVNCYVEPVYTLDADVVVFAASLPEVISELRHIGFEVEEHAHSVNAIAPGSRLRFQFTTDERYQSFVNRAVEGTVLEVCVRIASLQDVVQGKLWAYADPQRRLSKRKKDELDLIRLGEAYPDVLNIYPAELAAEIRGSWSSDES